MYPSILFDTQEPSPCIFINPSSSKFNPAAFPTELAYRIIKMYSFQSYTVLDPFLGSGTTAEVALSIGRNAIGYEINMDYIEKILEKFKIYSREDNCFIIK